MIALAKFLTISVMVGVICALLAIGATGLLTGVPLAFLQYVPGDDLEELRQLPSDLVMAGAGGMLIGILAGIGSQLSGRRVNYVISAAIITACAWAAVVWTHPGVNMADNPGWFDYLESYRLTLLASLGGVVVVFFLGQLRRPFQSPGRRSRASDER